MTKSSTSPFSFGTHNGPFHADEVTACALLLLFGLISKDQIVRTRDPHLLLECEYVCDVGGVYNKDLKRFDHHQIEYQGHLSSAGMILDYLKQIGRISVDIYEYLNRSLILGVDAHDNGRVDYEMGWASFSHIISAFVPFEYDVSKEKMDLAFHEALEFTKNHIQRLLDRYDYILSCQSLVKKEMDKKLKFLVFDKSIPWLENFFELGGESHPACFVIMPSSNHWKLRGIPPSLKQRMAVRIPMPEKWAGLQDDVLKEISQIEGAVFCHKGRFVSVWESKADALKALEMIIGD